MTRDELIEAMARAICAVECTAAQNGECECNNSDQYGYGIEATAALTALEDAGYAVVHMETFLEKIESTRATVETAKKEMEQSLALDITDKTAQIKHLMGDDDT